MVVIGHFEIIFGPKFTGRGHVRQVAANTVSKYKKKFWEDQTLDVRTINGHYTQMAAKTSLTVSIKPNDV